MNVRMSIKVRPKQNTDGRRKKEDEKDFKTHVIVGLLITVQHTLGQLVKPLKAISTNSSIYFVLKCNIITSLAPDHKHRSAFEAL